MLDAIVAGVNIPELDPEEAGIGYGGLPNADGVVQLDSSLMHGPRKWAGGVAGIEGVRTPSLVAKAVAELTDHHLIVGEGARQFARSLGFEIEDDLNTEHSRAMWLEWRRRVDPSHWLDPEQRIRETGRGAAGSERDLGRGDGFERDLEHEARLQRFQDASMAAGPIDGRRRPHRPRIVLGHDELGGRLSGRRHLRRDDHQRLVVEDPRSRRRFTDFTRRPVCRQRRGRGGLDRPWRGEPLQLRLFPDRGIHASRHEPERRRHGRTRAH